MKALANRKLDAASRPVIPALDGRSFRPGSTISVDVNVSKWARLTASIEPPIMLKHGSALGLE